MITYFQAIIMGLLQGITELFPISSLGHSVVFAWVFKWNGILRSQAQNESFFLSFLVALHVATGLALLIFYRRAWVRIIHGFFDSVGKRRIDTPDSRLAWLLVAATIPAGLFGLIFEHHLRTQFAKPLSAIIFLFINGCILLVGDHYQRQHGISEKEAELATTSLNVSQKTHLKTRRHHRHCPDRRPVCRY